MWYLGSSYDLDKNDKFPDFPRSAAISRKTANFKEMLMTLIMNEWMNEWMKWINSGHEMSCYDGYHSISTLSGETFSFECDQIFGEVTKIMQESFTAKNVHPHPLAFGAQLFGL